MKAKLCVKCGHILEISHFTKMKSSKDGLRSSCRSCRAVEMKNWRKTGSTVTSQFEGKSMTSLDIFLEELKMAYKKHGLTAIKRRLNK